MSLPIEWEEDAPFYVGWKEDGRRRAREAGGADERDDDQAALSASTSGAGFGGVGATVSGGVRRIRISAR
jgi:hypothetical protein